MLKWMGILLIIGSCGSLGMAARDRLHRRVCALASMIAALERIRAEIDGRLTPLPDILQMLADTGDRTQQRLFGEMCERAKDGAGLSLAYHWSSSVRDLADELAFGADETRVLSDASSFLGRYEQSQQLRSLDYTVARLEEYRRNACEELRKRGSVYRTCGVAAGIITVLVLL